ncbi:MAG: NAD(P)H-hydrate dehydratase, partial [Paracoccus sp. (in: a-proteobacteria)]|nr:NAD(P)H-hydrate dehydratase [Paracoccus sp. (in: a-proteobacteria)]
AMDAGQVTASTLMERAGQRAVEAILAHWPDLQQTPSARMWRGLVLCGPGNNGGDGFVMARHLAQRGWRVRVLFLGDSFVLSPEAGAAYDQWRKRGLVAPLDAAAVDSDCDLVIDALFGIGLNRPLSGLDPVLAQLATLPQSVRRVAVDLPSGLCSDSGRVLGDLAHPPRADLTITFQTLKPGHLLADGLALCGHVVTVDLCLGAWEPEGTPVRLSRELLHKAGLDKQGGHKFHHGHLVVVAGGPGRGGAARLSARAGLRIGAGLVTLCPPQDAIAEHAGPPDALMRRAVNDSADLAALLQDRRVTAVCLGPGCGVDRAASVLPALLDWGGPAVLDADALTALAQRPELVSRLHPGLILTPHDGEFARLFPDLAEPLAGEVTRGPAPSRLEAARQAQARSGATVVLKGPDTVIAAPDQIAVHARADLGWLATAGAGDVLAGLAGGLLARGRPAADAARLAVVIHADLAKRCGPGLIADDLPDGLPALLTDISSRER